MQVAITGVAEGDQRHAPLVPHAVDGIDQVGEVGDWHHDIFVDLAWGDALDGVRQRFARGPQTLNFIFGKAALGFDQSRAFKGAAKGGQLVGQAAGIAIGLDHQHGLGARGQVLGIAIGAQGVDGTGVHKFQGARYDGLSHDADHRLASGSGAGVTQAQGGDGLGSGDQPQGGLGDQRQGTLRANQQAGEVVAGGVFAGAAAALDLAAIAGDGA